ncbi:MAG: hypothetical protein PHH77_03600 [Victivallaceae bacterium]|nr:hypothetical protein [Victivallaceae bacterium]
MFHFYPLIAVWLILSGGLIALGAVYFTYRRGLDLSRWKRRLLAGLRMTAIGMVLLMLLCPGLIVREPDRQRSKAVILLDDSGSMAVRDLPGKISRYRAALAFAQQLRSVDFSGCRKYFYTFDTGTELIRDWSVPEMYGAQGGTDFEQAFNCVNRDAGLSGIAAVILLSDGLDYSGFSGDKFGVPVFAVKFGSDLSGVPDLRLEEFSVPQTLFTGEEFDLSVPVTLNGYDAEKTPRITFSADGREVKRQELKLLPGQTVEVPFKHVFTEPALHFVKIKLDRLADEVSYLNNETELILEVRPGNNYTVAYFPVLTNSFRPLVRQLRSAGHKFTAVYRLRRDKFNQIGTRTDSRFNGGIPPSAASMKDVDIFILAATRPGLLTGAQESILEQYVAGGGTLVLLGGEKSFEPVPPSSPLAPLMPVKTRESSFTPGRFRIVPGSQPQRSRFAERLAELETGAEAVIPALNLVESVKEGAEVLLFAEDSGKYPLLVALPYGRGKVVALLTNSLQLWGQGRQRQRNFGTFWEQLIDYAGRSGNVGLRVALNKNRLPANENLKVSAQADFPDQTLASPEFRLESALYRLHSDRALRIKQLSKTGVFYRAEFTGLSSGRFLLETTAALGKQVLAKRYNLVVVGREINESGNLKATAENFLKFCPEGRIYDPAERAQLLADLIRTIRKNELEREWYPLFETPFFYFGLLALLLAEWYLRRRFNLW